MLTEYYQAARHGAAVAEKDWFGVLKLTGADRVSWLQGMVTNDVERLAAGEGCYAAHLNAQGRVVGHMTIVVDENALWLSLERTIIGKVSAAFDKLLIMEDVQIMDASSEREILSVVGPKALSVIEKWLGQSVAFTARYSHREIEDCRVVVSDLGYDLWIKRSEADKILRGLSEAGATAIDHGTWDVLRTEAGIPTYGIDIDETTTLPELGERGINYEKGCYVGQEVVAKIKYLGHVNRRFVGLELRGAALPVPKSPIHKDGKEVGYVTTAVFSPGLDKSIALGFVNRAAYAAGGEVEIHSGQDRLAAKIVGLPFHT